MSDPIPPAQARAFMQRFALVAERQQAERAATTFEGRFDELEQLMLSVDDFGWRAALDDDAPVRARWALLRQRFADSAQLTLR